MSFGKRLSEGLKGRELPSDNYRQAAATDSTLAERTKIIIDYVLQHASGDRRPYLQVQVFNYPILGLLDSGASRTIVGQSGWRILQKLGLQLQSQETNCIIANGQKCISLGHVPCPMEVLGRIQVVDVLVVPDIPHTLILGVDF